MTLGRLCVNENPGNRLRQTFCVDRRFAASVAMCGPRPKRASCGVLDKKRLERPRYYHARTYSIRPRSAHLGIVLAYRMASRNARNPDDVTDLDDPEVDVSGMIAVVGAESVATEQAPTLRTRGELCAARLAQWDRDAAGDQLHDLLLKPKLSGVSEYVPGSDSDGASVGAPTRAHNVNDRSAPAFDMNSFAQVLS